MKSNQNTFSFSLPNVYSKSLLHFEKNIFVRNLESVTENHRVIIVSIFRPTCAWILLSILASTHR
jgi:hypothetical protein